VPPVKYLLKTVGGFAMTKYNISGDGWCNDNGGTAMDYISTREAAKKLGVTVRRVQQCCSGGLIEGAVRFGDRWMVPADAVIAEKRQAGGHVTAPEKPARIPMPLISGIFEPGHALEYIASLDDDEMKLTAQAEYEYFRGNAAESLRISAQLTESSDMTVRMSGLLLHAFSAIAVREIRTARRDFYLSGELPETLLQTSAERAMRTFIIAVGKVLLHMPIDDIDSLRETINELPQGMVLFCCYLQAHIYYLQEEYELSMGVAGTAFHMACARGYQVDAIYLGLMIAMDTMRLKRPERGEYYFRKVWGKAKADGFLQPFAEHHGLLQGLVESCLKKEEPEEYQRIVEIVYRFSDGWRSIHNPNAGDSVTSDLTAMEFSVAMLAAKGWKNKEIAERMHLSVNTVKEIMKLIYQKLDVSNRKELDRFMLK